MFVLLSLPRQCFDDNEVPFYRARDGDTIKTGRISSPAALRLDVDHLANPPQPNKPPYSLQVANCKVPNITESALANFI